MKILMITFCLLLTQTNNLYANDKITVLITGANRGIGLEYAKQYIAKGYEVIGTARKPAKAENLKKLGATVVQLDVTDQESIDAMDKSLDGKSIDILINNAGYFDRADVSLDKVNISSMEHTFSINTLGPLRVIKALIDNLEDGDNKTVINMSSGLASIENSRGRWYGYRASKTALNQITKILSAEYKAKGFIYIVMNPGWVQTDMGGKNATYTVEQSVSGQIKVIDNLTKDDNGKFYNLEGKITPW